MKFAAKKSRLKFRKVKRRKAFWKGMEIKYNSQRFEQDCPIDSVHQHPRNPRRGDVEAIGASVATNGFYGAIVVQESTRFILAGNHRWLAAKQMNAPTIPVMFVDVDEETALRILLADNKVNELGGFDDEELAGLLTDLQKDGGSLEGTGYDGLAFESIVLEAESQEYKNHAAEEAKALGEMAGKSIQYTIVFANEAQQKEFFDFLKRQKQAHPEGTAAERLLRFIAEKEGTA